MWQDMVPSPCTTKRAYSTCKAIRGSLVGHRGSSNTCMLSIQQDLENVCEKGCGYSMTIWRDG